MGVPCDVISKLSRTRLPSWISAHGRPLPSRELSRRHPLQSLVRKEVITADGRPLSRPTDETAAREFDEIERFTQDQRLCLALLAVKIEILRERGAWSAGLIHRALAEGALFPESVLRAIEPGIVAFEDGRHWDAVHILVPQVERIIRGLGQSLGAETLRYNAGKGELRWSSLERMLEDPAISEILDVVHPDLARQLKYTFVDSRGWNLRNGIAHGIATTDDDMQAAGLVVVLTLLCLATLRTPTD